MSKNINIITEKNTISNREFYRIIKLDRYILFINSYKLYQKNRKIIRKGINDNYKFYRTTILGRRRPYNCEFYYTTKRTRGQNWLISLDLIRCKKKGSQKAC